VLAHGFMDLTTSGATLTTIFIPTTAIKAPRHTREINLRLRSPSIRLRTSKEMKYAMGVDMRAEARSAKNNAVGQRSRVSLTFLNRYVFQ